MERKKENALPNFISMIKRSWTYDRMTQQEKNNWVDVAQNALTMGAIIGTYDHRMKVLNALYHAYLSGIGYNGFDWREPDKNPKWELFRQREEYLFKVINTSTH